MATGQEPAVNARAPLDWHTPPGWVASVEQEPLLLLSDHAHCELKAAASAQALIARHASRASLVRVLTALAIEELEHFARVCAELERRGGSLARPVPSPYAEGLLDLCLPDRRDVLLDRLLVASLIEARSLERFRLLAKHSADASLVSLYAELRASEARHRALFVRLARSLFAREEVDERLAVLRAREGRLVASLPFDYRMHSGPAPIGAACRG